MGTVRATSRARPSVLLPTALARNAARFGGTRPSPDSAPDGRPWGKDEWTRTSSGNASDRSEEGYFRQHEAKLIEKLRERAKVDEIVEALAVKLQTDDPRRCAGSWPSG